MLMCRARKVHVCVQAHGQCRGRVMGLKMASARAYALDETCELAVIRLFAFGRSTVGRR